MEWSSTCPNLPERFLQGGTAHDQAVGKSVQSLIGAMRAGVLAFQEFGLLQILSPEID
jgi:hypothetical protein